MKLALIKDKWVRVENNDDILSFGQPVEMRSNKGTWIGWRGPVTIIIKNGIYQYGADVSTEDGKNRFMRALRMISRKDWKIIHG